MKRLFSLAVLLLVAGLAGRPKPSCRSGTPRPEPGKMPQCNKDHVKSTQSQLGMFEKLRAAGPSSLGRCAR